MSVVKPQTESRVSVDQYLALERRAEARHYYLDGRICAMAGESDAHGDISVNIVGSLFIQLRGKPCRVRTKDTKVRSGPILSSGETARGLFSYPDVLQTWNPSLTDYLLVSQDHAQVEHFTRQADGAWSYRLTTGLAAGVTIASIQCTLKLAEVYERVKLKPDISP